MEPAGDNDGACVGEVAVGQVVVIKIRDSVHDDLDVITDDAVAKGKWKKVRKWCYLEAVGWDVRQNGGFGGLNDCNGSSAQGGCSDGCVGVREVKGS